MRKRQRKKNLRKLVFSLVQCILLPRLCLGNIKPNPERKRGEVYYLDTQVGGVKK
jgi:hypothetical protein